MYVVITQDDHLIFTENLNNFIDGSGELVEGIIVLNTEKQSEIKLIIEDNHIVNIEQISNKD